MERKISDIKDKKLKAENITLAAIYNILFTNDIVCSLIVEMLSALRKSGLCRFRVKQQGNKLEQLMLQYEKKINKIAGNRAFFMADANQYVADEVQPDLLKMEYSIKMEFDKCRIENSALLAKVELARCMAELACLSLDKRIEEVRPYNKEVTGKHISGSLTHLKYWMNFLIFYIGEGIVTSIKAIIAKGVWLSYNENLLIVILSAAQSMSQTS